MGKLLTLGATLVGFLAVLIGLLFSPIPRNLGLYQWLASRVPQFVGLTPAFLPDGKWGYTFEELYSNDLTGQNAIVTGANSGVGYETSLALARLGASVTLACRNPTKCKAAAEKIQSDDAFKGKLSTMTLDTSSLASVKKFSEQYLSEHKDAPLDLLYLNAGIGSAGANDDGSAPLSEDGIEMVFATNHVGHHLLWKLLHPLVTKSKMARIVLTSSAASYDSFEYKVATDLETLNNVNVVKENMHIYGQSKLAQVLWAKKLTRMLGPNSTIFVNAVHPGAVDTGIWQKNPMIPALIQDFITYLRKNVMWTAAEGALTMLYLGVATTRLAEENVRGKYFHPQSQKMVNPLALDVELQNSVWDFSDELVKDYS
jgi:NAD(P)-dependent dehydrogenase (short-subunit alcohol dehydrogenase family)